MNFLILFPATDRHAIRAKTSIEEFRKFSVKGVILAQNAILDFSLTDLYMTGQGLRFAT